MVVACVCYVGRESEPLCFRVYGDSEEIPMQFAAYAALDVIDEQRTLQDASLYAYAAPTGLKILVGLSLKAPLHEQELRAFFKRLHRLYADAVSNPFFLDTIETPRFLFQLDAIVQYYSTRLEVS
ncbi:hypothetical protein cyc_07082 [Cyclospora cayetanensis]|uniref:Trafficking protein particle complex subunit n=1 Tax=Cyclospora cayetanensis TaxID=88456 RepID=A0A1D3DA34_9EIME|nr:hypothetical protein cyc_07082 [Cyclospora cayetanensis]